MGWYLPCGVGVYYGATSSLDSAWSKRMEALILPVDLSKKMRVVLHKLKPINSVLGASQVFISVTSRWPPRTV